MFRRARSGWDMKTGPSIKPIMISGFPFVRSMSGSSPVYSKGVIAPGSQPSHLCGFVSPGTRGLGFGVVVARFARPRIQNENEPRRTHPCDSTFIQSCFSVVKQTRRQTSPDPSSGRAVFARRSEPLIPARLSTGYSGKAKGRRRGRPGITVTLVCASHTDAPRIPQLSGSTTR